MNVLYIAYSCSPQSGSEEKIGWNIPLESAKTNKVFVITKEEQRQKIEEYTNKNKLQNICFYYADIPKVYKKIFKGAFYSGRLNIWQKKAVDLAEKICKINHIDIIHQITPIEFRSIGDYGKIKGVNFVCGPVGGGESVPKGLMYYAKKHLLEETIRKTVNLLSLCRYKSNGLINRCDMLLFANRETQKFMEPLCKNQTNKNQCITEIAIDESELLSGIKHQNKEKCVFLIAGRLVYRKGHNLLLDALKFLPNDLQYECNIVGSGTEFKKLKEKCHKLNLSEKVIFHGNLAFEKMNAMYDMSDVLIMPSIRETTGSVMLEAMCRQLPVIAVGKFGAAMLVDEKSGWLIDGVNKADYIMNLRNILLECIKNPEKIRLKGLKAKETASNNVWSSKVAIYNEMYKEALK